jgi:hypothetical protein
MRKTLKNKRGGFAPENKDQIIHCLSQLKRFAPCIHLNNIRAYQFFYNLGRLQELMGETKKPEVWWKPIEAIVQSGDFQALPGQIDLLQTHIELEYDRQTVEKGC